MSHNQLYNNQKIAKLVSFPLPGYVSWIVNTLLSHHADQKEDHISSCVEGLEENVSLQDAFVLDYMVASADRAFRIRCVSVSVKLKVKRRVAKYWTNIVCLPPLNSGTMRRRVP